MNINIYEMKRKTEIENNLLKKINEDFNQYINELENIRKESIYDDNFKLESNKFVCLKDYLEKQNTNTKLLLERLFTHPQQTYWAFQYFFMKKKDFMGMNLTGLIDGKVETGLGFRNCIMKFFSNQTQTQSKHKELIELFEKEADNNLIFYKIKSDTLKWDDFELPVCNSYYIIYDYSNKKYYVLLEN
jgi:hypothetical protein